MVISTFYSGNQGSTSSRGIIKAKKDQCQSQIPMTSSSNHWLFSFTVFLQGNTGNILSRHIQEAVTKPVVKCQCSINPTWQPHSFQYSLDSSRPVFQSYIMGKSFNTVHFPIWKASFISDRLSLFVSSFWTQLCRKLKISRDPQTAFHIEPDGQKERLNQILEQYLWITLINKAITFFNIYGRNPSFESIHISQDSPAGKLSTKLQSVQQVVKEELESEIRRFKNYADKNRAIPPDFQPVDKSVHPVFHVSLLEPVKQSTMPNQNQLPPPPVIVGEKEEWEVAQVLDSKLNRGKLRYLVEWKGFSEDPERTAWEQASNLTNSPDIVKDFHSLYSDKPGPITSRVGFYGAWWGLDFMRVSSSPGMHL
ncbi:hypothetical protein O181_032037 [Austropuccinia psidii MF-1]|uniref:Chromo domain-containing protein n=1 Tax=Austropuccinia psidii MF-1 TaxID=1389203 RepID=A0A9Q3CYQ5_9BASI|nr:hypothetical protein [Austropuccinia psidii MF-1]